MDRPNKEGRCLLMCWCARALLGKQELGSYTQMYAPPAKAGNRDI
jgi:hypothetical protein